MYRLPVCLCLIKILLHLCRLFRRLRTDKEVAGDPLDVVGLFSGADMDAADDGEDDGAEAVHEQVFHRIDDAEVDVAVYGVGFA